MFEEKGRGIIGFILWPMVVPRPATCHGEPGSEFFRGESVLGERWGMEELGRCRQESRSGQRNTSVHSIESSVHSIESSTMSVVKTPTSSLTGAPTGYLIAPR